MSSILENKLFLLYNQYEYVENSQMVCLRYGPVVHAYELAVHRSPQIERIGSRESKLGVAGRRFL